MISRNASEETGDRIAAGRADWTFMTEAVATSFDTHVRRSVPLYDEGHDLIVRMSDFFVDTSSRIVDLGCSTGALTRKLALRHAHKAPMVTGVDVSEAMIVEAREASRGVTCDFVVADAADIDMAGTDVITAYYTVQFVRPYRRQALIDKIFADLRWGGAFFMFEKVRASDARFQDIFSTTYVEYKQQQGFSDDEIINKQMALKGVLEPFSTAGNVEMLERAGFKDIVTIFKFAPFEGFLCVK